ncbi:aliphatic sulfonate ABC transporter substrate-binding protein [Alicyclobacillus macrosporangiidus]|uniref:Putative aliphatic sulfonates-binding protein n=1 Tax=Alicyclobacillus macrosporangiidus TaxID=392015 RepID=A0A1I7FSU4_9BACL|nr:aliphatic sulfonate ABC transporter substrate-binding protein [Alicyclobacillus macrosporangiidus]SFU39233.1 sulfonate transport system substrate-binding protein [Alicyclobacillus macrosporangiidus]
MRRLRLPNLLRWLGLFAFVFFLVLGCGNGSTNAGGASGNGTGNNGTTASNPQGQSWPKELRVGYQKSSFLLFLKEKGTLEQQLAPYGVKVSWYEFTSGPPLLEALNSGSIDVGETGGAPAALAQASPQAQFVYLAYEPEVARAIVVPKNSPIHSIADLKGKKMAFAQGSSAHYTVLTALQKAGLKISDIQPVNLQPPDARSAFERGNVDAWGIWDPYLADAEMNAGARILVNAKDLPKQYSFIVGRRDYAQQYPQVTKILLDNLQKVTDEIHADTKSAAQELSAVTKIPVATWQRTLDRRDYGVYPLTDQVIAAQQKIADTFFEAGLIRQKVRVQDAVQP